MKSCLYFIAVIAILISCNSSSSENNHKPIVAIRIFNNDASKEKESIKVTINDQVIFSSDSTTGEVDFIPLESKLKIQVSTLDNRLSIDTTYQIPNNQIGIAIWISYENNFLSSSYLNTIRNKQSRQLLIKNNLPSDTIISWLKDSLLSQQRREIISFQGKDEPRFKISFYSLPYLVE